MADKLLPSHLAKLQRIRQDELKLWGVVLPHTSDHVSHTVLVDVNQFTQFTTREARVNSILDVRHRQWRKVLHLSSVLIALHWGGELTHGIKLSLQFFHCGVHPLLLLLKDIAIVRKCLTQIVDHQPKGSQSPYQVCRQYTQVWN
jgi:hypothetical protein